MRFLIFLAAGLVWADNPAPECAEKADCSASCTTSADTKETEDTKKAETTGQEVVIKVDGMTCGSCASKISTALEAAKGVNAASVCHKSGKATVTYDQTATTPEQLVEAIQTAGYKANLPQ